MKFRPCCVHFSSNLEQIWYRCPQNHFGEFRKNWCSKNHALLRKIIEFLCYFLIYVPIQMKFGLRYLHTCSAFVSSVIAHGRPYCSCGHMWKYIYASSVKPYDILKVTNALVKNVYCVTEYSVCSLINEKL